MQVQKCPNCSAPIRLEGSLLDRDYFICENCDANLVASVDPRTTEARLRVLELEHEADIVNRRLNHEEMMLDKQHSQERFEKKFEWSKSKKILVGALAVYAVMMALLFGMVFFEKNPGIQIGSQQIQVASAEKDYVGKDYELVEEELRGVGFDDISLRPKGDMGFISFDREGAVTYVSIGGNADFESGTWFDPKAHVIIEYHSRPNND